MAPEKVPREMVVEYLRLHKVMQTSELARHFACSKKTIFRILNVMGYLTSYNRNSSGITLVDIPEFDNNGLWEHKGFYFSKWGTLKETIQHLVENSKAGLSAGELRQILQVDIYHHVTSCVEAKMVFRDVGWRFSIYFSMDTKRLEQLKERNRMFQMLPSQVPVSKDKIIQVLVVALMHHVTSMEKIMPILESEGVRISKRRVRWIFDYYEIEKKGSLSAFSGF